MHQCMISGSSTDSLKALVCQRMHVQMAARAAFLLVRSVSCTLQATVDRPDSSCRVLPGPCVKRVVTCASFGSRLKLSASMISDASKLALVGVAATLGILVGFRVSNNLESTMNAKPHIDAIITEQRLLQEEQAANQQNSNSDAAAVSVGPEPPKWQLVIEKVNMATSCAAPSSSLGSSTITPCRQLQSTSSTSEMRSRL